jgi:hypothetical protein
MLVREWQEIQEVPRGVAVQELPEQLKEIGAQLDWVRDYL